MKTKHAAVTKAVLCLALLVLSAPFAFPAHAQSSGFSIFNENMCTERFSAGFTSIPICTLCDLLRLIQNLIYNFVFYALVPIGAIVVMYGGYLIMTSGPDSGKRSQGRQAITAAAIGIAISLGSWIIVTEVFSIMTQGRLTTNWSQISCQSGSGITAEPGSAIPESVPAGPPPPSQPQLQCSANKDSFQLTDLVNCVKNNAASRGLTLKPTITTFQGSHACNLSSNPKNISCHYGGTLCNGEAHAADFNLIESQRTPQNWAKLQTLVNACGARGAFCEAGNTRFPDCTNAAVDHIHANDAKNCGCN